MVIYLLLVLSFFGAPLLPAQTPSIRRERLAYHGSWDDTGPLYALLAYPAGGRKLPLIVCMHGYSETAHLYRERNLHLARQGWFVAAVEMRGRGGSAGRHDSGGLDVHDIYDAVQALLRAWPDRIDPDRIGIQGWSGGGDEGG